MLIKKLRNKKRNNKGFTLVEVLIAATILGFAAVVIVRSFFLSSGTVVRARKEAEATYVAKNILESTIANYYYELDNASSDVVHEYRDTNTNELQYFTTKMVVLKDELLSYKTSVPVPYKNFQYYNAQNSKFAQTFKYKLEIVPSGKNGLGESDTTSNYLHIYRDKCQGGDYVYMVSPTGSIRNVTNLDSLEIRRDVPTVDGDDYLKNFTVLMYNSADSSPKNYSVLPDSTTWSAYPDVKRYFYNYSYSGGTQVSNNTKNKFTNDENINNGDIVLYSSDTRVPWTKAIYSLKVTVYDSDDAVLTVEESAIEVTLFA